MGTFSMSEFGNFALIGVLLFIYYYSDIQRTRACRICFWLLLFTATAYTLAEAITFATLIFPHSASLPNATEGILDRSVPHNPGSLMQMEARLDCIFNQNLYQVYNRRQSPGNTCDPYIVGSFIPHHLLIAFVAVRLVILAVLGALLTGGLSNRVGVAVAKLIFKSRPVPGYRNRYVKNTHASTTTASYKGSINGMSKGAVSDYGGPDAAGGTPTSTKFSAKPTAYALDIQ